MKILSSLFLVLVLPLVSYGQEVHDYVTNPSVAISNEQGRALGSGTVFLAKGKTYVLTCGHLFPEMRSVIETVVMKNGIETKVSKVTWKNPRAYVIEFDEQGQEVGGAYSYCNILAYSPPEDREGQSTGGIDLALLEVTKKDFLKVGARFVQDPSIVRPGLDILHIGNMFGIPGCVVKGNISRLDVKMLGTSFNLAILNGRPGSSGGGVFAFEKGAYVYVGMTVRGDSAGLMLLKTPAMIREWLREEGYEYVIGETKNKPMPSAK